MFVTKYLLPALSVVGFAAGKSCLSWSLYNITLLFYYERETDTLSPIQHNHPSAPKQQRP